MIGWGIVLAYLVITLMASRTALAALMNRPKCTRGYSYIDSCINNHSAECAKPLGQLRARTLADGFQALGIGSLWFVALPAIWLMKTTPMTDGETKRYLAESDRRIKELEAEITRSNKRLR